MFIEQSTYLSFTLACDFFIKTLLCVGYEATVGRQCRLEGLGRSECPLDTEEPRVGPLFCLKAHDGESAVGQSLDTYFPCMS